MQKGIIKLTRTPAIIASSSVVGSHEHEGPLGGCFDIHDADNTFGMNTWEKSESEMQRLAFNCALAACKNEANEIDALFAGDLLNQCVGSSYGLVDFDVPYFGLYGACSTAAEGLILASMLYGGSVYDKCAVVSSSHNCSAERQFRFPVEYGGQRSPTAQWTVTGAGAFILADDESGYHPVITDVLPGRVVDKGITDVNNMGAAMAPAAIDTLTRYFDESGRSPDSFSMIVSGDLGSEGASIVTDFMNANKKIKSKFGANYVDCGLLIYNKDSQDKHAGGSGCGCSAVVMASHILKLMRMRDKGINDILFIGTGAMMSPMSLQQGSSIPGIAHLVHIVAPEKLKKEE